MYFKRVSLNSTFSKGITLIELALAVGIFILILGLLVPLFRTGIKSWEKEEARTRLMQEARAAMNKIITELKYTNAIIPPLDSNYVIFGTEGDYFYLDDKNAGHSRTSGTWENGTLPGGFASDYDISSVANSTATYRLNVLPEGFYEIYAWWIATTSNTDSAHYIISTPGGAYPTVTRNQRVNGGRWNSLNRQVPTHYFRRITITNNHTTEPLPPDYTICITFNHQALVAANKSFPNGKDVQITYGNTRLDRVLDSMSSWNSANTRVCFQTVHPIDPSAQDNNYFLRYGYTSPPPVRADCNKVYLFCDNFEGYPLGSNGSPTWSPGAACWQVVNDAGNKVYEAHSTGRCSSRLSEYTITNTAVEAQMKFIAGPSNHSGVILWTGSVAPADIDAYLFRRLYASPAELQIGEINSGEDGGERCCQGITSALNTWYKIEGRIYSDGDPANHADFVETCTTQDGINYTCISTTTPHGTTACGAGACSNALVEKSTRSIGLHLWNGQAYFDNFRVRKFLRPEPSVSIDTEQPSVEQQSIPYYLTSGATISVSTPTAGNLIADGIKLVYRGHHHREFFFASANNAIYYGSDNEINPETPSNRTLIDNVYRIGNTPIFSYYQRDGYTPATTPSEVAIIRVAFEVRDPQRRAPPYRLTTNVYLRGHAENITKLVINEINYFPPFERIAAENFDGTSLGQWATGNVGAIWRRYNNWIEMFDDGLNGWSTETVAGGGPAPWQHGQETTPAVPPFDSTSPNMWATNLAGNYNNNAHQRVFSPLIRIPTGSGPLGVGMSHWIRCNVAIGPGGTITVEDWGRLDRYRIVDNQRVWTPVSPQMFSSGGVWRFYSHPDPSGRKGEEVGYGFRFFSNPSGVREGWYVENFAIFALPGASPTLVENTNHMVTSYDANTADDNRLIWEIGEPAAHQAPPRDPATPRCAGTLLTQDYPEVVDASIEAPPLNLTHYPAPVLTFYQFVDVHDGGNFDGGRVEVSTDGGSTWRPLTPSTPPYHGLIATGRFNILQGSHAYCNDTPGWQKVEIDLTGCCGNRPDVRLRWRFASDRVGRNDDQHEPGWFIDDIEVVSGLDHTYQWVEIYNPTPYPIRIASDNTDNDGLCSNTNIDACDPTEAYRIYTQTHLGCPGQPFDRIIPYSGAGGGHTIPAYGYAIVAANSIVYTDMRYYASLIHPTAVKLLIQEGAFGCNGFTKEFGQIRLTDNTGRLLDYVGYNLAFYDNLEYDATLVNFSTTSAGPSPGTHWSRGTLSAGDGFTDNNDNTLNSSSGRIFGTNRGGNYTINATSELILPSINLLNVTAAEAPTLQFYQRYRFADAGDTGVVQYSTDGGSTWNNLDPPISGTQLSWQQVTRSLAPITNRVIMLRYRFTSNAAGNDTGWYIDDIAVHSNWGGKGNRRTLERRYWQGDSRIKTNWGESLEIWGTPGYRNSLSPPYT